VETRAKKTVRSFSYVYFVVLVGSLESLKRGVPHVRTRKSHPEVQTLPQRDGPQVEVLVPPAVPLSSSLPLLLLLLFPFSPSSLPPLLFAVFTQSPLSQHYANTSKFFRFPTFHLTSLRIGTTKHPIAILSTKNLTFWFLLFFLVWHLFWKTFVLLRIIPFRH